jgi:hypothetical protein
VERLLEKVAPRRRHVALLGEEQRLEPGVLDESGQLGDIEVEVGHRHGDAELQRGHSGG